MLQKKLEQLDSMGWSETLEFEKQVINSLLPHDEMFEALRKIAERKKLIDRDSAIIELSEGISFD